MGMYLSTSVVLGAIFTDEEQTPQFRLAFSDWRDYFEPVELADQLGISDQFPASKEPHATQQDILLLEELEKRSEELREKLLKLKIEPFYFYFPNSSNYYGLEVKGVIKYASEPVANRFEELKELAPERVQHLSLGDHEQNLKLACKLLNLPVKKPSLWIYAEVS